jgi:hypothetical protein
MNLFGIFARERKDSNPLHWDSNLFKDSVKKNTSSHTVVAAQSAFFLQLDFLRKAHRVGVKTALSSMKCVMCHEKLEMAPLAYGSV